MKHVLLIVLLASCSGDAAATAPDRATVEAMRTFCKLDATPFEQRGLAMAHWIERARRSSSFAATWGAMIRGDKAALAKIQAAADAAVGLGKCEILESFGQL